MYRAGRQEDPIDGDAAPGEAGELPEVAVGLIVAEDGRVLLQHRDRKPGIISPGRWGLFGGHLEPGERARDAFLREMDEELGWRPRHFEPHLRRQMNNDGWHVVSNAFAAHLDVPVEELSLNEGADLGLFEPSSPPEDIIPSVGDLLAKFERSDAYKRVKRHWEIITATAIIVDREGRYLLQHRDDKPGIDNPGLWGSFGGRIEPYETPPDGLLRELQEELGWQPKSFELYASGPYRPDERTQLIYVYAAPVEVPLETLVLGEGQGLACFAPGALPEDTVPAYRALLERFSASDMYPDMRRRAAYPPESAH